MDSVIQRKLEVLKPILRIAPIEGVGLQAM